MFEEVSVSGPFLVFRKEEEVWRKKFSSIEKISVDYFEQKVVVYTGKELILNSPEGEKKLPFTFTNPVFIQIRENWIYVVSGLLIEVIDAFEVGEEIKHVKTVEGRSNHFSTFPGVIVFVLLSSVEVHTLSEVKTYQISRVKVHLLNGKVFFVGDKIYDEELKHLPIKGGKFLSYSTNKNLILHDREKLSVSTFDGENYREICRLKKAADSISHFNYEGDEIIILRRNLTNTTIVIPSTGEVEEFKTDWRRSGNGHVFGYCRRFILPSLKQYVREKYRKKNNYFTLVLKVAMEKE